MLLSYTTPMSLVHDSFGIVSTNIMELTSMVPACTSPILSTAAATPTTLDIQVLPGERPMATDNKTLGKFMLTGIPPSPRGVPQVEVSFDIDANGILNVKAVDKASGKEQSITITASSGLSKDEVEKMKQDAKSHEAEDNKKKEVIEVKNQAESLMFTAEKSLKDAGDKVKDDVKKEVEEKIKAVKDVKDKDDIAAIKKATEELSTTIQKIGEAMYKDQKPPEGQQPPPGAQPGAEQKGDSDEKKDDKGPVDAEFEDVKDKKDEEKKEDDKK